MYRPTPTAKLWMMELRWNFSHIHSSWKITNVHRYSNKSTVSIKNLQEIRKVASIGAKTVVTQTSSVLSNTQLQWSPKETPYAPATRHQTPGCARRLKPLFPLGYQNAALDFIKIKKSPSGWSMRSYTKQRKSQEIGKIWRKFPKPCEQFPGALVADGVNSNPLHFGPRQVGE